MTAPNWSELETWRGQKLLAWLLDTSTDLAQTPYTDCQKAQLREARLLLARFDGWLKRLRDVSDAMPSSLDGVRAMASNLMRDLQYNINQYSLRASCQRVIWFDGMRCVVHAGLATSLFPPDFADWVNAHMRMVSRMGYLSVLCRNLEETYECVVEKYMHADYSAALLHGAGFPHTCDVSTFSKLRAPLIFEAEGRKVTFAGDLDAVCKELGRPIETWPSQWWRTAQSACTLPRSHTGVPCLGYYFIQL